MTNTPNVGWLRGYDEGQSENRRGQSGRSVGHRGQQVTRDQEAPRC